MKFFCKIKPYGKIIMKALLKIPFNAKDEAKKIARDNKCALFFEPISKNWELRGDAIPPALEKYVVNNSIVDEANSSYNDSQYYHYVIDMPFNLRERITDYGGYYHSLYKVYIVKAAQVHEQLVPFLSQPYSYEAWIERFINNKERPGMHSMYPQEDIIVPRDYQNSAHVMASAAKKLGGFLLADEVGLGKTISAALVAKDSQYDSILVITTLAAVAHWRKTFLKFNLPGKKIIIMNYDRIHKLFKPDTTKVIKKGKKVRKTTKRTANKKLTKTGLAPLFDLVVWDESHKMKNNTTMRSKLGLKISQNAKFNLYLSATAGQNPLELSYLAPLLAKITGQSVESMDDFDQWCKSMKLGVKRGDFGKWIWDGSQESIDIIHSLLFSGKPQAALRRIPSDIAGYPEISRELMPLELDSDELQNYQLAWQDFLNMMQNVSTKTNKKTANEHALVAKLRLRQKASLLKIPYTVEHIEDLLDNGHQVAVSVAFKETLHEIVRRLQKKNISCSTIYGEQTSNEKEEQRVKFQQGDNRVVIFTVEEAISLHQGEYNDAPRSMLIHDLRWSAISMSQIEGRTHRDGKFSQIYWLYFSDTVEEDIAKIVVNRVISMKAMVGDDTKTLKEIEELLLSKVNKHN